MIYGYARVSTDGQSVDAQVKQLRAAGCEKVFRETASGARFDLAQLRRVLLLRRCRTVLPSTTQGPTQGDRRVEHYLDHRDRLHRRHHRAFHLARSE
jgi:predicted site-specific integrase-resolvase